MNSGLKRSPMTYSAGASAISNLPWLVGNRVRKGFTHAVLVGERGHDAGGKVVREGSPQKDKVVEPSADLRRVTGIGGQVGVGRDEVRDKGVAGPLEFDFAVADVDVPHALSVRSTRGGG